jgi:uncharacterized membrane protein
LKNKTVVALLTGSTLWCLAIVAAPLFHLPWLYELFSRICHQDASRSLHLAGEPLAVCIRCTSIYFAATAAIWLGLKSSVRWLRVSIVLMLCEFVFARLVLDSAVLRSMTGILIGLSAAPFVRQALEEIVETEDFREAM